MCPEGFCFVSLQRHDFQALKEVEILLDRRRLESQANTYAESTPFTKDCRSCILRALFCIALQTHMVNYSIYYNWSLDLRTDLVRL